MGTMSWWMLTCEILRRLEEEQNILYKGVETSPYQMCFITVRLTTIRNVPKWTISVSGGFELLQMVLELDTEWCASEGVGPTRGWIVRSHVGWRGE